MREPVIKRSAILKYVAIYCCLVFKVVGLKFNAYALGGVRLQSGAFLI